MLKALTEYRRLLAVLEQQQPAPVYLLCGEEQLHLRKSAERLSAFLLDTGRKDLNVDRLDGTRSTPFDWLALAANVTLLGGRRIVFVADCDRWVGTGDLPDKKEAMENLLAFASAERRRGSIVLTARAPDKRTRLYKKLEELGSLFIFEPPSGDREVEEWLDSAFRHEGLSPEPGVSAYLADVLGDNLEAALTEVRRAGDMQDEGDRTVTLERIQSVVVPGRSYTMFEFTDALASRDAGRALKILDRLLEGGVRSDRKIDQTGLPLVAVTLIHKQLRQFSQALELKGASPDELAEAMGVKPWIARKIAGQARALGEDRIGLLLNLVVDTDLALKSTPLPARVLLERLVFDFCGGAGPGN